MSNTAINIKLTGCLPALFPGPDGRNANVGEASSRQSEPDAYWKVSYVVVGRVCVS
jgi:hypothetical protein